MLKGYMVRERLGTPDLESEYVYLRHAWCSFAKKYKNRYIPSVAFSPGFNHLQTENVWNHWGTYFFNPVKKKQSFRLEVWGASYLNGKWPESTPSKNTSFMSLQRFPFSDKLNNFPSHVGVAHKTWRSLQPRKSCFRVMDFRNATRKRWQCEFIVINQRFLNPFSPSPFGVSPWILAPHLTSKSNTKQNNKLFAITLLNGKVATVFWKRVV